MAGSKGGIKGIEIQRKKIKIYIYEGDPFTCFCCGRGPTSAGASNDFRNMLSERSQIVKRLHNNSALFLKNEGILIVSQPAVKFQKKLPPRLVYG